MKSRETILIVDDLEINRAILNEIIRDDYDTIEACDGVQAIEVLNSHPEIAAILLDLVMPNMDGLDVLREMNKNGMIRKIPVFLITAEDSREVLAEGYRLGAVDVITKPFMAHFLKCRIDNILELYDHRNQLEKKVAEQVERIASYNQSMVETLATLLEFRDCESGEHVKRISKLTGMLMREVSNRYPEYFLPETEIEKIATSSVLHDVGKISISDGILNKPGRLTQEEFETMKLHTVKGAEILQRIPNIMDEGVYKYSYDICRHHHERWDGRGYPDGLKGDEISIWAQVVSVADVYDALTSERVYKDAYSHEKAVEMIKNNECGVFNPKVLEAFEVAVKELREEQEASE